MFNIVTTCQSISSFFSSSIIRKFIPFVSHFNSKHMATNINDIPAQTIMMSGIHIEFEGAAMRSHASWIQNEHGFWKHTFLPTDVVSKLINGGRSVGFYGNTSKTHANITTLRQLWSL